MEPESSIRRVVSNVERKEYGDSAPTDAVVAGTWGAGSSTAGETGLIGDAV
jgi:hypothetical protein